MPNKNKIKVLFCAAEATPLAKVGGLGDVVGSLPKDLAKAGLAVSLILPFYAVIKKRYKTKLVKKSLPIEFAGQRQRFDLYLTVLPGSKVPVYLIKHKFFDYPEIYFGRKSVSFGGRDVKDIERYTFFSKAVVEVIRALDWPVDIIHCHDWHTALLPTYIDEYSIKYQNFPNIKTLFTIHNLANQGVTALDILDYASLHHDLTPALMEDYYDQDGEVLDLMKIGILSADYISTVSPTYAKEILTKEYGEGLEQYLRRRKKTLLGILNGIDTNVFDPKTDKFIFKKYSLANVSTAKKLNKNNLQAKLGLPLVDAPLYGLVTRLVDQKGFDILLPAIEKLLSDKDWQLVILGTGQKTIEDRLKDLARQHPKQIKAIIGFDVRLAQRIYAASDFFLMPSGFEPCGLGQMIAMRYGSLPLVRATGGLKDTVKNNKNGFVFKKYQAEALIKIWQKTLKAYKDKNKLSAMIKSAMQADWSWRKSADSYIKLYQKLLK